MYTKAAMSCWHVFASALSKLPWTHLKPSFMRDRTSLEYAAPEPFIWLTRSCEDAEDAKQESEGVAP